jgi:hypothetical protein
VRNADAREPGGNYGWFAAWDDRDQALDAQQVQRTERAEEEVNPTQVPIEEGEYPLTRESAEFGSIARAPERCGHIGDGESDTHTIVTELDEVLARVASHLKFWTATASRP